MRYNLCESLSEDEKIDLWNSGVRKVNVKACSDDKLIRYYNIANNKGYSNICAQIQNETDNRGLTIPGSKISSSTCSSGTAASSPVTTAGAAAASTKVKTALEELKQIAIANAPRTVTYKMSDSDISDYQERLFNELVPGSGSASTEAGEILSAWNYGMYRYYNDGDWFYGFGTTWNTSSQQCTQYLKDHVGPGLGRAAMYASNISEFEKQGNKLILNKIFKDKLYDEPCILEWRSYNYK